MRTSRASYAGHLMLPEKKNTLKAIEEIISYFITFDFIIRGFRVEKFVSFVSRQLMTLRLSNLLSLNQL